MHLDPEEKAKRERHDVETVISTEAGRRVMWRLLEHCGIYRGHEGTPDQIMKQEGRRQAGLFILGIVSDASEELLFKMMSEARNRNIEEQYYADRTNEPEPDTGVTVIDIIGDRAETRSVTSFGDSEPIF